MSKTLDLGCGALPRNPFNAMETYGIDIRENLPLGIRKADLCIDPIPFDSGMFDFVTAFDFIEHIPRLLYVPARRYPFVEIMNEIYRVLKPGGIFLSFTPAYPKYSAFVDPTHVNIITENTFPHYFDEQHRKASIYGFTGSFKVLSQEWMDQHLVTQISKVAIS
jgi:SAM-dependent methyltransferase